MKIGRNEKCPCGSGIKYKNCCLLRFEVTSASSTSMFPEDLEFRAIVTSGSSSPASVTVAGASVNTGQGERVLVTQSTTVAVNAVPGTAVAGSSAVLAIPASQARGGRIEVEGNAAVSVARTPRSLAIKGGQKELRASNATGLWVRATVVTQRDTGEGYFDFLFGTKGAPEVVDEAGNKQRPHLAVWADGNGKFVRLEGHPSEISGYMHYETTSGVQADRLSIRSLVHNVTIDVQFENHPAAVELVEIAFH